MENNSDNVAEIEKYAFLLGSAIKNEDTDQFFSIYDTILPKDIPDNQVKLSLLNTPPFRLDGELVLHSNVELKKFVVNPSSALETIYLMEKF